jgi:AraC-like DNA-binding protein
MITEKLIEHRTVQHSSLSEASVYLTTDTAQVALKFGNPLVCSMRTGRKLMQINRSSAFEFLPGETILVNSSSSLDISFPEACPEKPAECMVIEFERSELDRIVNRINDTLAAKGFGEHMELDWDNFAHLRNAPDVQDQMNRVMTYYETEHGVLRDALIESAHDELVLRLLQAQSVELLKKRRVGGVEGQLSAAIDAIVEHPSRRFSSEALAKIANMSEASLFRHFKFRYGITPAKFATMHRMTVARQMLAQRSIADVAHALGFSDIGHFTKVFRETVGETPGEFRRRSRLAPAAR